MTLLVTGASGYLGSEVVRRATGRGWTVAGLNGSAQLDIRDARAVEAEFDRVRPDRVIHTAYRQHDRSVTFDGSVNVARAAARVNARLVHVSTDVVFSGRLHRPYRTPSTTTRSAALRRWRTWRER